MSMPETDQNDSETERRLPPVRVRTRILPPEQQSPPTPEASAPASDEAAEAPNENAEYKVGYKNPPKHTQFKKGQVANPLGRPRGAKSLPTLVDEALSAEMTVTIRGRSTKMSKRQAMVMQHVEKAMRGDLKTFAALVKLDPKARSEADQLDQAPPELGAEELAVLLAYWKATTGGEEGER